MMHISKTIHERRGFDGYDSMEILVFDDAAFVVTLIN